MRSLWLLPLLTLAACGGASGAPPDGGEEEDPYCHWDCFGYTECQDGQVTEWANTPVPCAYWTGSCPISERYTCMRGCRSDIVDAFGAPYYRARDLCEENRPKQLGDGCSSEADCLPQVALPNDGGGVTNVYLTCAADAGVCAARPPPTPPADWLGQCGYGGDTDPSSFAYGVLGTGNCSSGWCLFVERTGCVAQGCTMACDSDDDCPQDSVCWLGEGPGGVCKPGPQNSIGELLRCPR